MKMARLCVAALMSSCALEMFSFAISSSRTFRLFLFSFVDMAAFDAASATAGIVKKKRKRVGLRADKEKDFQLPL